MIRVRTLVESALIRIDRIDHPRDEPHVDPEEEVVEQYSVGLLERGEFSVRHRGLDWRVTPNDFFLSSPGQVHQYAHDERQQPPDDVCVAVFFTDRSRDEIAGMLHGLERHPTTVPLNNRRAYARDRLLRRLVEPLPSMVVDLLALELLVATFDVGVHRLYRREQLSWYAQRIDRARRRMDEDFADDHTLADLSRDAAMSPFHFARVFRSLIGMPPHHYLIRRRLAAAVSRLSEGDSVTATCYAVGFRSLSHFITSFRRAYGVPPSRIGSQSLRRGAAGLLERAALAEQSALIAATDTTSS
jgi:AraC-like DNA-binding protein